MEQFINENHLRWDSLGEFLALAVSLEHFSQVNDNIKASILGKALDSATERLLDEKKSPSRHVNEIDNRGSHFYLALYWAEAISKQEKDPDLKLEFAAIAKALLENKETILQELNSVQGNPVDTGGYYLPNIEKTNIAMRPSTTLNSILYH